MLWCTWTARSVSMWIRKTVEQDYAPAGTLPVIRGKVYTEVYAEPLDYPALGNGRIVKRLWNQSWLWVRISWAVKFDTACWIRMWRHMI